MKSFILALLISISGIPFAEAQVLPPLPKNFSNQVNKPNNTVKKVNITNIYIPKKLDTSGLLLPKLSLPEINIQKVNISPPI